MHGKRYFVSGGAGVIGMELVSRLCARGAAVLVGDLKPRPPTFDQRVVYRQGDLNTLQRAELERFAPDVFVHLAATFERSEEAYGFWEENFWHNVHLSHHLMTLAKEIPSLRRVVFASSYLIYDRELYEGADPPVVARALKESDPISPRNLTGMAKLAHEVELRFLEGFRERPFSSVCARIYRGYGKNSRDVISRWIRALLAGEPIRVFKPEGRFDYVYAADTAEGLIRLADADVLTGVVNLGTGRARRVQDIVDILNVHFPRMQVISEASSIAYEASCADLTRLQAATGWQPEYTLEKAIPEIIAFERTTSPVARETTGNMLVTSAGAKFSMVRSLIEAARKLHPRIELWAGDADADAPSRYIADRFWKMPPSEDGDVESILSGCTERGIRTVVPSRDGELAFWARHRDRFAAAGIDVVVSPGESIRICLDKLAFFQFGTARGLPFVPTAEKLDEISAPFYVVKERHGAGSRNIGLCLEKASALRHASSMREPLFQPFVPGREMSVDGWLDSRHRVKGLVMRWRDRVVAGESQVTTTFRDAAVEAIVVRTLEALRLRGPVVLQAIVGPEGMRIIECNSRFGGASAASIAAGLDSLFWSLAESRGVDIDQVPFNRIDEEIRMVRTTADVIIHGSRL